MDEFLAGNFLYMRRKRGPSSTAYTLEVVEHHETDPDAYYTMSRSGITHFVGSESEFTSLDQWEREFYLYQRVRRIDFFAQCVWGGLSRDWPDLLAVRSPHRRVGIAPGRCSRPGSGTCARRRFATLASGLRSSSSPQHCRLCQRRC